MCGRYRFTHSGQDEKLSAILDMMERNYHGAYKTGEIFPGDCAPAVIQNRGRLVAVPAVFGFPGYGGSRLLINARSETAAEKPGFARELRERRIVLPASGFYEWSHDAEKTKYLFETETQSTMYLCGIYQILDGQCRFVILTREANESMQSIHNRMPVLVDESLVRPYLTDYAAAMGILGASAPELRWHAE